MARVDIEIPNGSVNASMKNADELYIKVTENCTWCFSDPNGIFPVAPAANSLPANNSQVTTANSPYGPCVPISGKTGTVTYGSSIPPAPCTLQKTTGTLSHTITVGS